MIFKKNKKIFCFLENIIRYFMQIVSLGDNLHEISNPISGKDSKNVNLPSAETAQRMQKVDSSD